MWHLQRSQDITLLRVRDACPDFLGPKVIGLLVRLGLYQDVVVVGQPEIEAGGVPQGLIVGLALLGRVVERLLLSLVVQEAGKGSFAHLKQARVPLLADDLLLDGQGLASHGQGKIRGALEQLHRAGVLAPFLADLDAGRARANDRHILALDFDAVVGPERRVVHDALEFLDARPCGDVALRGLAREWCQCILLPRMDADAEHAIGARLQIRTPG